MSHKLTNTDCDHVLQEFIAKDAAFSIADAAQMIGVPRPRIVETMLLNGWFRRKKPWSSLIGAESAVRSGLVTRKPAIKPTCLLILGAIFGKHPSQFIRVDIYNEVAE